MRIARTTRRSVCLPLLALLAVGGLSLASPQEKKEPEQEQQAESPESSKAETGKEEGGTTPEEKKLDTTPASAAARMLREKGQIVSQSGDLKIDVQSNLFTEFPGFELGHLTATQRDELVKLANRVYCTCGCRGDTVARCVVNDPSCVTARTMLQSMLDAFSPADPDPSEKPEAE